MINKGLRELLQMDNRSSFHRKVVVLISVFACLPAATAAQTTWNVPGDFATIQEAIDAVSVVNGDTIQVGVGEYSNPSGVGYGPQNYAMNIQKELTIQGAGNDSDPALGTVFAPFSAGGQATNGVVFMDANNIVFRDIYIDAQKNQEAATGQVVARGFQAGGTNLLIENVTVEGTVHSCAELNQAVDSTLRDLTCDTTVAGYNVGNNARGLRIVSCDNLTIENLVVLGPAPNPFDGSGYYLVSFQEVSSYTLRNISMTGGAGNFGQYIFVPFLPDDHTVTYEGTVVIEDVPVGINLVEDPSAQVTLNTSFGVVQFSNVDIPLQRDGLGVVNNLVDFVCQSGIPYRSTVGTQERYFATLAEAQADAATNGGVADEITCPLCPAAASVATRIAGSNTNTYTATPPAAGSTITFSVTGDYTNGVVFAGYNSASVILGNGQFLLSAAPYLFTRSITGLPSGSATYSVPSNAAYCGLEVYSQVLMIGPTAGGPTIQLTNSQDLTYGF
ncbi:MAG: hypothetical protein CMJ89_03010 [Planctomycetes bacterium]|nr:hypothetical protein [Planctomycetota bacterium]